MDIFVEFERLINFGLKNKLFEKEDVIFMRNSLIELFKIFQQFYNGCIFPNAVVIRHRGVFVSNTIYSMVS